MARKKDRAFFVCPRWAEVPGAADAGKVVNTKTLAAIAAGRPVAHSALRTALMAALRASGTIFDVEGYIVDQRAKAA